MKSFKRTVSCVLAMILLLAALNTVSAAAENRVYGRSVSFYRSEAGVPMISTTVQIENNSGFMGFSITVTYDPSLFKPVGVQRSAMLSGMFEDSVGFSTAGSFRVVYSSSAECVQDGELFTLFFEDLSTFTEDYEAKIGLSYSPHDTFNEQWEDVMLNCEDIKVPMGGLPTMPTTESETEPSSESETNPESEPEESTTVSVIEPQPEKKLSERLADWYASRTIVVRILLWIFVKPLIRLIAATE